MTFAPLELSYRGSSWPSPLLLPFSFSSVFQFTDTQTQTHCVSLSRLIRRIPAKNKHTYFTKFYIQHREHMSCRLLLYIWHFHILLLSFTYCKTGNSELIIVPLLWVKQAYCRHLIQSRILLQPSFSKINQAEGWVKTSIHSHHINLHTQNTG